MASPKISLRGVTKAFGPKKVLQGIDLDVAPGESMVVIGGSGTGKSVLLKCILGLLRPERLIKIDGEDVVGPQRPQARRRPCASSACCSRAARCSIRCASGRTWPSA
jgi:ABC-type transporter Mla maintaining outer membrane lipid asymmetry ATPase subunit MlaF